MGNYHKAITLIGKVILAGIFIVAGALKIVDPTGFASSVGSFELVPEALIPWVVTTVPTLEVLGGLALFYTPLEGGSASILAGLSFGFALFYAWALVAGIQPQCGCFGSSGALSATPSEGLLRAAALTLLGCGLWAASLRRRGTGAGEPA